MRDKKKMVAYLTEGDLEYLKELNGFIKGLEAAGKKVPGGWCFRSLIEDKLKEETK